MKPHAIAVVLLVSPFAALILIGVICVYPKLFYRFMRDMLTKPICEIVIGPPVDPEDHQIDPRDPDPCEIDKARGYRPMPRTLEEAWPSAQAISDGSDLQAPSHPRGWALRDRLTMAVGVLSIAATLAIVITTTPK